MPAGWIHLTVERGCKMCRIGETAVGVTIDSYAVSQADAGKVTLTTKVLKAKYQVTIVNISTICALGSGKAWWKKR